MEPVVFTFTSRPRTERYVSLLLFAAVICLTRFTQETTNAPSGLLPYNWAPGLLGSAAAGFRGPALNVAGAFSGDEESVPEGTLSPAEESGAGGAEAQPVLVQATSEAEAVGEQRTTSGAPTFLGGLQDFLSSLRQFSGDEDDGDEEVDDDRSEGDEEEQRLQANADSTLQNVLTIFDTASRMARSLSDGESRSPQVFADNMATLLQSVADIAEVVDPGAGESLLRTASRATSAARRVLEGMQLGASPSSGVPRRRRTSRY